MDFERFIRGLEKYLDREVYDTMESWQRVLARVFVGRMAGSPEDLKKLLTDNPFIRLAHLIDDDGHVDVDRLMCDLRREIEREGKVRISTKIFDDFIFEPKDVDKLHAIIMEG